MKLRQKLAVALASAMVLTSVPVVTMAASTNGLTKIITVAEKAVLDLATAPQLKVKLDDYNSTAGEVFYLQLENATWNKDASGNLLWEIVGEADMVRQGLEPTPMPSAAFCLWKYLAKE